MPLSLSCLALPCGLSRNLLHWPELQRHQTITQRAKLAAEACFLLKPHPLLPVLSPCLSCFCPSLFTAIQQFHHHCRYTGLKVTLAGAVVYHVTLASVTGATRSVAPPLVADTVGAITAGVCAYPLDTVAKRLMVQVGLETPRSVENPP